jgi:hypothetical protein
MEQGQEKFASEIPASRGNNKGTTTSPESRKADDPEKKKKKKTGGKAGESSSASLGSFFFPFPSSGSHDAAGDQATRALPAGGPWPRPAFPRGGGDEGDSVRPGPDKGMQVFRRAQIGVGTTLSRQRHHSFWIDCFIIDLGI